MIKIHPDGRIEYTQSGNNYAHDITFPIYTVECYWDVKSYVNKLNNDFITKLLHMYNIPFYVSTHEKEYLVHKGVIITESFILPDAYFCDYVKDNIDMDDYKNFLFMQNI